MTCKIDKSTYFIKLPILRKYIQIIVYVNLTNKLKFVDWYYFSYSLTKKVKISLPGNDKY